MSDPEIEGMFESFRLMQDQIQVLDDKIKCLEMRIKDLEDISIRWPTDKNLKAVEWLNEMNQDCVK